MTDLDPSVSYTLETGLFLTGHIKEFYTDEYYIDTYSIDEARNAIPKYPCQPVASTASLPTYYPGYRLSGCGNGVTDQSEGCDDANADNTDGCASCAVSPFYACGHDLNGVSVCAIACGDGKF